MGNILALLRDLGKIPVARDLFIKLDSIGARILMLDLRIVVGMLSQPTLLLCLRLVIILGVCQQLRLRILPWLLFALLHYVRSHQFVGSGFSF